MAGEAAVNKASDIFSELSEAAKAAAVELFKLAGKVDNQVKRQQTLYQRMAEVFTKLSEPMANLVATGSGVVHGFRNLAQIIPGVKSAFSSLDTVGKSLGELSGILGGLVRVSVGTAAGLVKFTADLATSKTAMNTAAAAGAILQMAFLGAKAGADAIGGTLSKLAPEMSKAVGQGFEGLGKGLSKLGGTLAAAGPMLANVFSAVAGFGKALLGVAANLAQVFANLTAWVANTASSVITTLAGLPTKLIPALADSMGKLATGMLGPLTGIIQTAITPLRGIQDAIAPFINALNPALMEQLNLAFNDLMAVVGRALVPIVGALIPVVRLLGDALVPVSAALMPVFESLAKVLMNLASAVIPVMTGVIQAMIPHIQAFADQVVQMSGRFGNLLVPIVDALLPIFFELADSATKLIPAISQLVGIIAGLAVPLLNWAIPPLVKALRWLADTVLEVINWIRSKMWLPALAGAGGAAPQNFKLGGVSPGASIGASTRGANFSGVAELGRNLQQAAFATGMTPEMRIADNTDKMAKGIDALVQGQNKQAVQGQQFQGNKNAPGVR